MAQVGFPQGALTQIYNDDCPPTVNNLVRYVIDWSQLVGDNMAVFNFSGVIPAAMRGLQGVYVDNSACALTATFTDPLGNVFQVPPGWEAMLPCWYGGAATATVSLLKPASSFGLVGSLGQQTAVEFLNHSVPNVTMWPAQEPGAVMTEQEATAGGVQKVYAVKGNSFYGNIIGIIAAKNTYTAMAMLPTPLELPGTTTMIEKIIGGVIAPISNTIQGANGVAGVVAIGVAQNQSLADGVPSARGVMIAYNSLPAQLVPVVQCPQHDFVAITNNEGPEFGIPANQLFCQIMTPGGTEGALPPLVVNLTVKAKILG
jgi:hypothetical protein